MRNASYHFGNRSGRIYKQGKIFTVERKIGEKVRRYNTENAREAIIGFTGDMASDIEAVLLDDVEQEGYNRYSGEKEDGNE